MPRIARLVRRADIFYFRAAVPQSLTERLGLREIKFSLRTSDPKLATMRCRVLSNAVDALFDEMAMNSSPTAAIHEGVRSYFRDALSRSLELAHMLPSDPKVDLGAERASLEDMLEEKRQQLATQSFPPSVQSEAVALLRSIHPGGQQFGPEALQQAYNAVLRARIENDRILAAQLDGRYDQTSPQDPLFQGITVQELPPIPGDADASETADDTLDTVFQAFIDFKDKQWAGKTAADHERVMKLASGIIGGGKPIKQIGIGDVKALRNALASLPPNYMKAAASKGMTAKEAIAGNKGGTSLAGKTQLKYFSMFREVLSWAEHEGYIDKMPGANVKVAGGKIAAQERKPYSPGQLKTIFDSPLYRGHRSEARRSVPGTMLLRDGKFWLPLIALFSGMRLGEIVQLLTTDLREENGIWFFDVSKGEDKNLKTASSQRRVPVHRMLLEIGILDLLTTANTKDRLFWEIEKGSDGHYSHNPSKFWGRYARKIGVATPGTAFHSFRHNFTDALRAAEQPEYINKALVGHSNSSVHSQYGGGPSLKQLKAAIDKVEYESLDLSFLKPKQI